MERLEVFENMVLSGNSQWKSTGPPSKGFVLGYLIKKLFILTHLFIQFNYSFVVGTGCMELLSLFN